MNATGIARWAATTLVTAAAQEALLAATRGSPVWERKNFRGNTVNLAGGITTAVAGVAAALGAPESLRGPSAIATLVAATTGAIDDFAPDPGAAKGFRGHLGALARGEITTGSVKLLGISGAALVSGALLSRGRRARGAGLIADTVISGGLIAGTANLMNLFDLRPGRALKVAATVGAATSFDSSNTDGRRLAATTTALATAAACRDLSEETMLGDVGANTLGTLLGLALAAHPSARLRAGGLVAVASLVLASEKVSFSRVIERSPVLSRLDHLGRSR